LQQVYFKEVITMLGLSSMMSAASPVSNQRLFIYEVSGIRQSEQTVNDNHAIRQSTQFISVPFNRMNEVMQQIHRLGGTIVGVRTATLQENTAPAAPASEAEA
jgi:phycocyanin-associated, rod